tara:strand:- start:377 stop:823 length:447 start_codon:yes stop_codon:yes gene_type:complete
LIASYLAAISACAVMLTAMSLSTAFFESGDSNLPSHPITGVLTVILMAFWFALAAAILALPGVIIGYPLAVFAARRLRGPGRTALAGAALGPFVGSAATLSFFFIRGGLAPTSWVEQAMFLVPVTSAAGAAMGWITCALEARRLLRAT